VKGLVLEWEESPFEWVRPWRFGVVRRYRGGPLREMRVLATLEPEGEGTRLTYRTSVRPRGLLGLVTIPIQIGAISRYTFGRVFKRYAAGVAAGDSRSEHVAVATPRRLAGGRLQQILNRMEGAGADAKLSAALVDHVIHADDLALARIRPYELASVWGASRRDMLTTCLHGTREGL
jgi:hypothetical protein